MKILLFLAFILDSAFASIIDVQVDEKKAYNHIADSVDLLSYICLLCVTILTLWSFKTRRIRFLHESGLAVVYGLLVGLLLKVTGSSRNVSHILVRPVHQGSDAGGLFVLPSKINLTSDGLQAGLPDSLLIAVQMPKVDADEEIGGSHKEQEEDERPPQKLYSYFFHGAFSGQDSALEEKATFNPEIFFYLLLPPIIFHAGYSMRKKAFFDNLGAILAFALLGTIISTTIIAIIVYGFAQFITTSVAFKFLDLVYFGAIISATDPVTVLAIFQDLHADVMLNGLILGESLLNDAVAIVLCGSIEGYAKLSLTRGESLEPEVLLTTVLRFFTIILGSVGLGSLIGASTALMTKFTYIRDFALLETSLFFLMSYSSYLIAEICEMSGIVSVLFCGIFQAHYTFRNLSAETQLRTRQFSETLNFLSENFIFCYLGVSMFTFEHHYFSFIFIFGTFVAIAVARAAHVYPLSLLLNLGRQQKIPMKYQHMLWFAGLRGAMAFALAVRNTVTEVRQLFFTTTCVITIATVIFNGGMTVPVLTLLEIPVGVRDDELDELLQNTPAASISIESNGGGKKRSWLANIWKGFDAKFMKPLLTSTRPSLVETLPDCCAPLGHLLSTDEQMGLNVPLTDEDELQGRQVYALSDVEAVGGSLSSGD